jgi:hypothetical protein
VAALLFNTIHGGSVADTISHAPSALFSQRNGIIWVRCGCCRKGFAMAAVPL